MRGRDGVRVILGLGNPGPEYENTRHNVGFRVLEALAKALGAPPARRASESWIQEAKGAKGADGAVLLARPLTYMNRSGDALEAILDGLEPEPGPADLLVVTDDVALPLGRMRLRTGGSAGGHNGLASIETALADSAYPRLRVGVGGGEPVPGAGLVDFVLGPFTAEEERVLAGVLPAAVDACRLWLSQGPAAAQERYNGWRYEPPTEPTAADERMTEE